VIRFLVDNKTPREKSGGVCGFGIDTYSIVWGVVRRKKRYAVLLTGFLRGFTPHPTKGNDSLWKPQ
jgi:hypothetical protein